MKIITIMELFDLFLEGYQEVAIYDLDTNEYVYEGLLMDYEGNDYEVSGIDAQSENSVNEFGYPVLTININTQD